MDLALVAACAAGDADAVAQLLAAGADPNAVGGKPLLQASSKDYLRVVEMLLEAGADARAQASVAALYACSGGHLDVIVRLEQAGADVRGCMQNMLQSAVQHGHANVLVHLLAHGTAAAADLDSAVAVAISLNRLDLCDLLLAAGANVHSALSKHRGNALEAAAFAGNIALVEQFLERGLNAPALERQASLDRALIQASTAGHTEVVRTLLAAGADVRACRNDALVHASHRGHGQVLQLLLAAGADVHDDDDQALRSASGCGQLDAVVALLAAGADVHAKDDEALRSASGCGQLDTVVALLAAGADVHAKDDQALSVAAGLGHDTVVAHLLAAGADARSGKYRALKQTLRPGYGNVQGKQRALEHLVAAGAVTWPLVGEGGVDSSMDQTHFVSAINKVIALEQRLEASSERGDVADVVAVLTTPSLAQFVDVDSAFGRACGQGHEMVVARLIAAGADVHDGYYDDDVHGESYVGPLQEACEAGHVAVVALLVAAGADVNMLDGAPLGLASENGHLDLIDWLLQHGADVHANKERALCAAAAHGHTLAIARLLAAGAVVHTNHGAVYAAVDTHDTDRIAVVRQLIATGADLSTMNDRTLALAVCVASLPLVELLLKAGANVHAQNDSALDRACSYRQLDMIDCLLAAGADVARMDWTQVPEQDRARIVLRVRTQDTGALPRWIRLVRVLHLVPVRRPLHRALQRARDRLDRPPASTLGTDTPTRAQLIAHLQTAGRRFARDYWTEGLPLFFKGAELGPVPNEFLAPALSLS